MYLILCAYAIHHKIYERHLTEPFISLQICGTLKQKCVVRAINSARLARVFMRWAMQANTMDVPSIFRVFSSVVEVGRYDFGYAIQLAIMNVANYHRNVIRGENMASLNH